MSTHNISFCREIRKLFTRYPLLSRSMAAVRCKSLALDKVYPDKLVSYLSMQIYVVLFVCVEVLRPSQPIGVMSSTVTLPIHTLTGQA